MKFLKLSIVILFFLAVNSSFSQTSFDKVFKKYTKGTVEVVSVEDLAAASSSVLILDAREFNEYQVSHLKDAIHVGHHKFDIQQIMKQIPNKNQLIVVYCSIGVRSEIIGHELKNAGYTHVKNLYGGIFEWKNKNFSIVNSQETETDSVHAFSKEWSKWLQKGIKVYE